MQINPINNIGNVYKSNKARKSYSENVVSSSKDSLAISGFAKELSLAKKAVDQAPDIRQAKVDDIKKQMEAGSYNVSASQVADRIISRFNE